MGSGESLRAGDLVIVGGRYRSDGKSICGIVVERVDHTYMMCRVLVKDRIVILFENELTVIGRVNV